MRSVLLTTLVLAFLSSCGGGKTDPDAGGAGGGSGGSGGGSGQDADVKICIDNDGDGVPGTGDCSEEPVKDCNDSEPMVSPAPSRSVTASTTTATRPSTKA